MSQNKKNIIQTLKAVILALILVAGVNYTFATDWVAPTQSPPGGNTLAPLNISNFGQTKAGGLVLNTGNATNGLIVLLGKTGLNTDTPTRTLHVAGDFRLEQGLYDSLNTAGTSGQVLSSLGAGNGVKWVTSTSGGTSLWTASGTNISNTNTGFVGVGVTNPRGTLHVNSTVASPYADVRISSLPSVNAALQLYENTGHTGWAVLRTGASGDFTINRDATENQATWTALNIRSGGSSGGDAGWGQVTVAENLPTNYGLTKFIVNGRILMRDGNQAAGKVLTSDANGVGTWQVGSPSDVSLKKNIQSLGSGMLDKVLKLNGVSFDWKEKNSQAPIGFIAQDVEKVFPEVVHTDGNGLKSVEYEKLVAPLVEAIKSQQAEINELKAEIQELKNK